MKLHRVFLLGMLVGMVAWLLLPSAAQIHEIRQLERVTIDPTSGKLSWQVSVGVVDSAGRYTSSSDWLSYEIHVAEATMSHKGETRRFSQEEADNVARVLAALSRYCRESTAWWDAGKGEKVDGLRAGNYRVETGP